jgi:hypothetical protein
MQFRKSTSYCIKSFQNPTQTAQQNKTTRQKEVAAAASTKTSTASATNTSTATNDDMVVCLCVSKPEATIVVVVRDASLELFATNIAIAISVGHS